MGYAFLCMGDGKWVDVCEIISGFFASSYLLSLIRLLYFSRQTKQKVSSCTYCFKSG